jgi:L-galactono-1,4-lactone dehydrogenase
MRGSTRRFPNLVLRSGLLPTRLNTALLAATGHAARFDAAAVVVQATSKAAQRGCSQQNLRARRLQLGSPLGVVAPTTQPPLPRESLGSPVPLAPRPLQFESARAGSRDESWASTAWAFSAAAASAAAVAAAGFAAAAASAVAMSATKSPTTAHAQPTVTASVDYLVPNAYPEEQRLVNWSGTHAVATKRYYQPETLDQLRTVVADAHSAGRKLRPVGSALSPNAVGFNPDGMVNLALMDAVLAVDPVARRVTVQAGARVSQVVEALRPHGLTLQNYASIAEQQMGGFTQVGAHGTGARIAPVDEHVTAMKLITPAAGELDLSIDDDDPSLFLLARTSLGLLGVVAEVTLQCVPAHLLVERTFTATRAEVRANHSRWITDNKHLRYMWIPHTDTVVVVTCNPPLSASTSEAVTVTASQAHQTVTESERLEPATKLLTSVLGCNLSPKEIDELSFTSLRDELLAIDPLNYEWVRSINQAEAEYWRLSAGERVDTSDRILGFDCGGQQWVSEVAFPVHTHAIGSDLDFVEGILRLIDEKKIPAPSPIEQRWTAPSSSPLSPASEKPGVEVPPMYSWVGIIMYLPDSDDDMDSSRRSSDALSGEGRCDAKSTRAQITNSFKQYKQACEDTLWSDAKAVEHWAKVEMPVDDAELVRLRQRVAEKYPVVAFNAIRELFDPKNVMSNELTDAVFGRTTFLKDSAQSTPAGSAQIVPTAAGG